MVNEADTGSNGCRYEIGLPGEVTVYRHMDIFVEQLNLYNL